MEHIEDIYRKICDNRWIGLLDKDFRLSVFDILYELFKKDIDMEHCRMNQGFLMSTKLESRNSIKVMQKIFLYRSRIGLVDNVVAIISR